MRIDPSFRYWMSVNKIDLRLIPEMKESDQARFRKALPYVLTRSEFLQADGRHRSRKSLSLYAGAFSMFSLSEGNPRVFINLMRELVREFVDGGGTVPVPAQARSAETTIHRFRSSLSAIPSKRAGTIGSILHLIEVVGNHFSAAQLDEQFRSEPPGSFVVDGEVDQDLLELVGRTLNSGGFVRVDDGHGAGVSALRGARLRLAYTLAPEFKLPLTLPRAINLSSIVSAHEAGRRRDPGHQSQPRLAFGV